MKLENLILPIVGGFIAGYMYSKSHCDKQIADILSQPSPLLNNGQGAATGRVNPMGGIGRVQLTNVGDFLGRVQLTNVGDFKG